MKKVITFLMLASFATLGLCNLNTVSANSPSYAEYRLDLNNDGTINVIDMLLLKDCMLNNPDCEHKARDLVYLQRYILGDTDSSYEDGHALKLFEDYMLGYFKSDNIGYIGGNYISYINDEGNEEILLFNTVGQQLVEESPDIIYHFTFEGINYVITQSLACPTGECWYGLKEVIDCADFRHSNYYASQASEDLAEYGRGVQKVLELDDYFTVTFYTASGCQKSIMLSKDTSNVDITALNTENSFYVDGICYYIIYDEIANQTVLYTNGVRNRGFSEDILDEFRYRQVDIFGDSIMKMNATSVTVNNKGKTENIYFSSSHDVLIEEAENIVAKFPYNGDEYAITKKYSCPDGTATYSIGKVIDYVDFRDNNLFSSSYFIDALDYSTIVSLTPDMGGITVIDLETSSGESKGLIVSNDYSVIDFSLKYDYSWSFILNEVTYVVMYEAVSGKTIIYPTFG